MAKKTPKSRIGPMKDINGRPMLRADTWDAKKGKCPKKARRQDKSNLRKGKYDG